MELCKCVEVPLLCKYVEDTLESAAENICLKKC